MQLALTTAGDLDVSGGRRKFLTGDAATRQAWRVGMRLFRGEWGLDKSAGFPWLEVVFVDRPSLLTIRAKLHEFALTIPGVIEVLAVRLTMLQGRTLSGFVDARFDSGDTARFAVYEPAVTVGAR